MSTTDDTEFEDWSELYEEVQRRREEYGTHPEHADPPADIDTSTLTLWRTRTRWTNRVVHLTRDCPALQNSDNEPREITPEQRNGNERKCQMCFR